MRSTLSISLLLLLCLIQSCNCSNDPVSPGGTTRPQDTTGFVSQLGVTVRWTETAYVSWLTVHIDSAGHPLSQQSSDTLSYNGHIVPGIDTAWTDQFWEVVDSGAYVFTWSRGKGASQIKASFSIVLHPFDITGPPEGSMVTFGYNDTIHYTPAGGIGIDAFYENSSGDHVANESNEPDNGAYHMQDESQSSISGTGYVYMMRHFIGTLATPAPFKQVNYDYWQSSKQVNLRFNW